MDKLHRVQSLRRILESRHRPVPMRDLIEHMECSEATVRRVIRCYRDEYGAPLHFDREANGWRLEDDTETVGELPGSWFSNAELRALNCVSSLMRQLDPELLDGEMAPLSGRIERMLALRGMEAGKAAPVWPANRHSAAAGPVAQVDQGVAEGESLVDAFSWRSFQDVARTEIARANRYGEPLSMLLLDLGTLMKHGNASPVPTDYDRENSILPHQTALIELVGLLQRHLREVDRVGRRGWKQCILLLPKTDWEGAERAAQRLQDLIRSDSGAEQPEFSVAQLRQGEDFETWLERLQSTSLNH